MYDTILVPTDGSEHARRAADHGLFLADRFDAHVHVLSVVDVRGAAGPFDVGGVREEFVAELEAEGTEAVEAIEDRFPDHDSLETAVVEGTPEETILEYATEHEVDLVAMGTHGRTGVERYVAGSVCEHVLRKAPMPVFTARAAAEATTVEGYDDVLVPTDGSDAAELAIDHAIGIGEAVGARIHAVNVVDLGDVAASSEYAIPNDLIESLEDRGTRATETVRDRAAAAGLEARTEVRSGYPARDLLEYVEDEDVDLVVMGTAGRTGLNRFLMGSTTERLVRHSPVPVLSVNARTGPTE